MITARRVLVALDGSPSSIHALVWAAHLAAPDGEIVAVHVIDPDTELARDLSFSGLTNWRREIEHQLRSTWTAPARELGVPVRARLVDGTSVVVGVLRTAREEAVDLIVIGTHGRHNGSRSLRRSAGHRIVHLATVPVITVPASAPLPDAVPAHTLT